jgi:hypothetical protein
VAHSILVIAYRLIVRKKPYRKVGGDYFDKIRPEKAAKCLFKRLEQLSFQVSIQETSAPALA